MKRFIVIVATATACLPSQAVDAPVTPPSAAQAARPSQPPPLPPSPVEYFRQLLHMNAGDRQQELARRPKQRVFVESKLKEFEALQPAERENRLRALELQWYLRPLMRAPSTNRAAQLQTIPERDRPLVEARLKLWDQLPADEQRDVLESELAVRTYFRPENALATYPGAPLLSPQQLERIKKSTEYLNGLPSEKREQIYRNFARFFDLSEHEKAKTLDSLSEAERKQMERTLQAFDKLPPHERDQCIAGFEKFRALSPLERQHFLRSAERWQAMSPRDRQVWRSLVSRKAVPQPPLPPGAGSSAANAADGSVLVATNR